MRDELQTRKQDNRLGLARTLEDRGGRAKDAVPVECVGRVSDHEQDDGCEER